MEGEAFLQVRDDHSEPLVPSLGWGLIDLPLRTIFYPPTH